jgi:hypothetical protein
MTKKTITVLKAKSRRNGYIRGGQRFGKETLHFPVNQEGADNWPAELGPCIKLSEEQALTIQADPHINSELIDHALTGEPKPPAKTAEEITDALIDTLQPAGEAGFDAEWQKTAKAAMRAYAKEESVKLTAITFGDVDGDNISVSFKLDGADIATATTFETSED